MRLFCRLKSPMGEVFKEGPKASVGLVLLGREELEGESNEFPDPKVEGGRTRISSQSSLSET